MVTVGKKGLSIEDFYKVVYKNEKVKIDEKSLNEVKKSFEFLTDFSKDKVIYGINTGFGPMAPYMIKESEQIQLQYN